VKFSALQGRIAIASLILGSVATIAAIWWYYSRQRDAIETTASQELAAIADVTVDRIANWRRERIGDGRVLASSGWTMRLARRVLSGRDATPEDRADLLHVMKGLQQEFLYTGAALVDREGNILIQSEPNHPVPSRIRNFARVAAQAKPLPPKPTTCGLRISIWILCWGARSWR
jgi:hypothetical protein